MKTENTTLRLRIKGIGYREQQLSLSERLGIINKRLNTRGPVKVTREGEYFPENIFNRNHVTNLQIVKLKKGEIIATDSHLWNSTELGHDFLDLEISGLTPANKDLTQATLIELIKERLTGLNTFLPLARNRAYLDINVIINAEEVISQPTLRNKDLETTYKTSLILPIEPDIPPVIESCLNALLEKGWFNKFNYNETSQPAHKLMTALSILSPMERDIVNRHFGIGDYNPQSLKEIGLRYSVSHERISHHKAKIIRYFRNLNRERDINLSKSGDK